MGSGAILGDTDPKGQVAVDSYNVQSEAQSQNEHRRRIFGLALPSYFNTDKERTLVRKLDIFLLYARLAYDSDWDRGKLTLK